MEWVETTGRNVEEAKDAALDQLGVDESDAEFIVMNEPRGGLFGRMRGEARVRARVRPTNPRPKRTRARRQSQEGRAPQRPLGGDAAAKEGTHSEGVVSVADHERAEELAEANETPAGAGGQGISENGTSGGGTRRSQRSRRRRAPRGARPMDTAGVSAQPVGANGANAVSAGAGGSTLQAPEHEDGQGNSERSGRVDATKEEAVGEGLSLEEQGESAREFVESLVHLLDLPGTVTMSIVDDSTVQVAVDGPELGILVGPGGATLAALQELARTVVQRRPGGRSERILVDVAGYRAKRAVALQRFTRQVVEEVLASLSERALEPMSASDRKVVHDTVSEIEGVVTRSVGEEPRRYIVVVPEPVQAETVGAEDD